MIAIDWGGYDYDALQLEAAFEQGGARLFICQLGGAGTHKLLARARAIGYITGGYYWNSALNSVAYQVDECSNEIEAENPDLIIMDFEHYWAKWQQYWDAIGGLLPWASVERMDPQKISDNGRLVCEGLNARWKGKYYLNYSADWFVAGYSPQSVQWLKLYPFHVASYPDYGLKPYSRTWQQIKAGSFLSTRATGDQYIKDWQPTLPAGLSAWTLWQYSSRIKAPGEIYAYDWNYFPGTVEDFKKLMSGEITSPPPVVPPVTTVTPTNAEIMAELQSFRTRFDQVFK